MNDHLAGMDLPAHNAIGVWHDLETALAGKNGYGGDVAEIYAYRLVSKPRSEIEPKELAILAGKNFTRLLRHFAALHRGVGFAIDERGGFRPIDLAVEEFPPFDWRVHVRVTQLRTGVQAPSIHELRAALSMIVQHADVLTAMLDELADRRGENRAERGATIE